MDLKSTTPKHAHRLAISEKAVTQANTAAHLHTEKDSATETHKGILKPFLESDTGSPAPSLRRYLASLSARFPEDKR